MCPSHSGTVCWQIVHGIGLEFTNQRLDGNTTLVRVNPSVVMQLIVH